MVTWSRLWEHLPIVHTRVGMTPPCLPMYEKKSKRPYSRIIPAHFPTQPLPSDRMARAQNAHFVRRVAPCHAPAHPARPRVTLVRNIYSRLHKNATFFKILKLMNSQCHRNTTFLLSSTSEDSHNPLHRPRVTLFRNIYSRLQKKATIGNTLH